MLDIEFMADNLMVTYPGKTQKFRLYLLAFLIEAYGLNCSSLNPDLEIFVNAQANSYAGEVNDICGSIQLSPVRSAERKNKFVTIYRGVESSVIPHNCKLLLDSGAFSDVKSDERVSPQVALRRQIKLLGELFPRDRLTQQIYRTNKVNPNFRKIYIVSYDRLIDEKFVNGKRKKIRWSVAEGELALQQTVEAAKYLNSQRQRLARRGCTLVQSCQGVDFAQYRRCVEQVLEYCQPGEDVLGLGGWCILGQQKRWLPTFWQTISQIVPLIAEAGIDRIHIFGVSWFRPYKRLIPPLPPLLWLCDRYGIKLTTDGRSPIGNSLWKSKGNYQKSGAFFPYWRDNLAWVRAELATLRDSEYYFSPPIWKWENEPLGNLI